MRCGGAGPSPRRQLRVGASGASRMSIAFELRPMELELLPELGVESIAPNPIDASGKPFTHAGLAEMTCGSWRFRRPHNARDRIQQLRKSRFLLAELTATERRDRVVSRALVVRRLTPLRLDPALLAHALEGRIERAFLDSQHLT